MVSGDRLGLGEADRDMRDRPGRLPQLREPPGKRGETENEEDRAERRQSQQWSFRDETGSGRAATDETVGQTFRYPYSAQIASQASEPITARTNGVRLGGVAFIACRIAPTVSRSSLAGGLDGSVGLGSPSFVAACGDAPGRNSGVGSGGVTLGFRTGVAAAGLAGANGGVGAGFAAGPLGRTSSSVRFSALSIADIAAEIGSVAEFCFAMISRLI